MRKDNRADDALRTIEFELDVQPGADASVLIKMGGTHVLCAVTVESDVPPFLKGAGRGWITAEYGMLPCSTNSRMNRESIRGRSGRTFEIQRLIGRSLRMMVALDAIGERTLKVDCDVINADGGTRTAAITGAAFLVNRVITDLHRNGLLDTVPAVMPVAAVSAGMVDGKALLDLDYGEDSTAEVDANFVMTGDGRLVEIQSTAEGRPFSREEFDALYFLAEKGIGELLRLGREVK